MQFLDFLAFIASMILFVYLSRKKKDEHQDDLEESDAYQNSEAHESLYSPRVRKLMNKLNVSEEEITDFENQIKGIEKKKYKKTPPPPLKRERVEGLLEEDYFISNDVFEEMNHAINPYDIDYKNNTSKASALIHGVESKKKMILFHAIFDKPTSLK